MENEWENEKATISKGGEVEKVMSLNVMSSPVSKNLWLYVQAHADYTEKGY